MAVSYFTSSMKHAREILPKQLNSLYTFFYVPHNANSARDQPQILLVCSLARGTAYIADFEIHE